MKCKHIIPSLLVLLVCSFLNAQSPYVVPRLVNFSGKVTDGQGKATSGVAGVSFAIYKDQYEGAPLWMETQNVQADAKGNYTVQLGGSSSEGLPLDLFSSGEARWLGVTVNGGQEQPRVLLLSVPYALKAADAETIGGLPPSAFVLANKGQVSGTTAKSTPASTAKNTAPPANPTVTGKGVVDFIPMWDTTSDIIDSIMFQKSSQIGVNTTSPAATLDVNGKTDVRDTLTLFPKGTDSTLAVNGTNFKVDQTGKVTFISGQTFPGTGTVTSVGLSAPSSDFTVSGTPVTKSGTLNLKWTVAPTNADTANAIVKRDSTGSFSAGTVTAGTVSAGVVSAAFVGATSTSGAAIYGTSTGTSGGSDGVDGVTTSAGASGVAGINNSGGIGVYGTGGVGVFGTGSSYGMQTDSNVQQARTAGGWVKAMAYVTPSGVAICFNSTLSGAAATQRPCGFSFHAFGTGDYAIDFGFQVDDRFFSLALVQFGQVNSAVVCTDYISGYCQNQNALDPNKVEVEISRTDNWSSTDAPFYLIVY
jgi:hypothetical protein